MPSAAPTANSAQPERIGARYQLLARLGRGGSADVFRVREVASGRELALKRLRADLNPARKRELISHLEREFYALAQLRHPRLIEVYDYGVSDGLPYYTMELLDGGDLRALAPLPWQRACELIYDIASSLALLHSRRYVHRDVTPSNIRCTVDGRAKLIDFGAMVAMGEGAQVIGTPAYIAPEVQQRRALDATTDLFSLGATLYFVTTGRTPFAAADLAGMPAAWAVPPVAPSQHIAQMPQDFDALVLALLRLAPAQRPRSAFEVMQKLAALAGLHTGESVSVPQGYLSTPKIVGRDAALRKLRRHLRRLRLGSGGSLWFEAEPGVGRSRLLELCKLEAKTSGADVVHLDTSALGSAFAGAQRLARCLLEALPSVADDTLRAEPELQKFLAAREPPQAGTAYMGLQQGFNRWLLGLSRQHPIVIAVDDVQRVDDATLATLALLAQSPAHGAPLLIATAERTDAEGAPGALGLLRRQSDVATLAPLTRSESDAMFASVFGSAANLALLCERIFAIAGGNPRQSLELAQHLVDEGTVTYTAGAWSLPDELRGDALQDGAEARLGARLSRLSGLARTLAEAQALSLFVALQRDDYRALATHANERGVDDALTELIAHAVVRARGDSYELAHPAFAAVLDAQLDERTRASRHAALASWAQHKGSNAWVIAHHLLHAGQPAPALDLLGSAVQRVSQLKGLDHASLRDTLARAIEMNRTLGRGHRERFDLMLFAIGLSLVVDDTLYWRYAPELCAQLASDTGLRDYHRHAELTDPAERMRAALADAQARYAATPEHARVYRVDEALRRLALHVATSLAVGTNTSDYALLQSLPSLLEPFTALSPMLGAVWENAEATCDYAFRARPERAYARWRNVYERLGHIDDDPPVVLIRNAVAAGLGALTAEGGLSEALQWIARLDREPLQRVNAMRMRRIVCLQHGDWSGAERAREQVETLTMQASVRQLFEPPLLIELYCHWLAHDLAGVKLTADRLGRLTQMHPRWRMNHRLAQGYFDALRGDVQRASIAFDECIEHCQPTALQPDRPAHVWLLAAAASLALTRERGDVTEARARASRILERCRELEIERAAEPIVCELALAEAKCGEGQRAIERLDSVIAARQQRGVSGLKLAACYEARTRIAIGQRNETDAVRFAALAVHEYRFGRESIFSSRYGQLLQEAEQAGVPIPGQPLPLPRGINAPALEHDPQTAALRHAVETGRDHAERARRALEALCELGQVSGGLLYLTQDAQGELKHAASVGPVQASEKLHRVAQDCMREQLAEAEMSAVLTELPWHEDTYHPRSWLDAQGERYEILVLYSSRAVPAHVGLAVVRIDAQGERREWSTHWLETLAVVLAELARC